MRSEKFSILYIRKARGNRIYTFATVKYRQVQRFALFAPSNTELS